MSGRLKLIIAAVIVLGAALVLPKIAPFGNEAVAASVSVSPEVIREIQLPFSIPLLAPDAVYPLSNTIITAWVVMAIITVLAFLSTRKMELVPGGLQNLMEFAVESIMNLAESVAGERARKFFVVTASIFIFVLFANLIGLIPGFGPIGIIRLEEGQQPPLGINILADANGLGASHTAQEAAGPLLAPLVRAPSTDVNLTLAIALTAMALVEIWGMQMTGWFKYWLRFFRFGQIIEFFATLFRGKLKIGMLAMGLIDLFVGLIELVSEFAKIIAFTFRLFGNIFAGEIVLLIMSFLFMVLPLIFYGFELFVGFIQAFVFFILALAFMTISTTPQEAEGHH